MHAHKHTYIQMNTCVYVCMHVQICPTYVWIMYTGREGKTLYGEDRKINPKASQAHVCSGRFASELFDVLTCRYHNSR